MPFSFSREFGIARMKRLLEVLNCILVILPTIFYQERVYIYYKRWLPQDSKVVRLDKGCSPGV